jgi:3-deoxy-D-manno-octulosonic-acid transferase
LGLFSHIHCQDSRTEAHFHALGLKEARAGTNLKSLSGPLPFDAAELERMTSVLQGRAVWLAASTHPGEDEIVLATHAELLKTHPGLVLILVPRHPERAHDIEASIAEAGLQGVRRSTGGAVDGSTQVYMADTLGEMGLWYALCPLTCLCGSFTPVGGHNPYEPAYAGSAVVHGPLYANFAETYARMDASGGAGEVADQAALTARIRDLLAHPDALQDMRIASRAFADAQEDQLSDFASALSETLSLG